MNNTINSVSFGSVTPIIATDKAKKNFEQILTLSNGKYELRDLTDVYIKSSGDGELSKASKKGKNILFLITGQDYVDSKMTRSGWGSEIAPAKHIDRKLVRLNDNSISSMVNLTKRTNIQKEQDLINSYFA